MLTFVNVIFSGVKHISSSILEAQFEFTSKSIFWQGDWAMTTDHFQENYFNTQLNLQPDKKPKKIIVTALSRHLRSRNIWRDKVINKTGCGQGYMKKGRVLLEAAKAGYLSDWDNKVGSFCNRAETKTRHDKIMYVYHRTLRLRGSLRLTHRRAAKGDLP